MSNDKLSDLDDDKRQTIEDAIFVWRHIADKSNTEEQQPSADIPVRDMSDGPGIDGLHSFVPPTHRIIHPAGLYKSLFQSIGWSREHLETVFASLQPMGVVSGVIDMPGKGRPRKIRFFDNSNWGFESGLDVAELEGRLIDYLIALPDDLAVAPAVVAEEITEEPATPVAAPAITVPAPSEAVAVDADMCHCPQCYKSFDKNKVPELDLPVLIMATDASFYFKGSFIQRQQGQIEASQNLIRFMLENGVPANVARKEEYAYCPHCSHAFPLPRIFGDPALTAQWQAKLKPEAEAKREAEITQRAEQQRIHAIHRAHMEAEQLAKVKPKSAPGLSRTGD